MNLFTFLSVLCLATACSLSEKLDREVRIDGPGDNDYTFETKFLGSEEDCPYVDSSFVTISKMCVSECGDGGDPSVEKEVSFGGGVYSGLVYKSSFGRRLDGLRIDIRSMEVDGEVLLFDDALLIAGANVSCTCEDEVADFEECTSPNVICTATFELKPTLRVQWAASLDSKFQTATSKLTLFVNNSASSASNITVAVGFDKAFKASADGEPLSYSTKSTAVSVFMHGENDEVLEIKDSKLVVEPEQPKESVPPPHDVEVRPPQKVVFVTVPTGMDSYSVGVVSTLSVSPAVVYDATHSFALFLILQVVVRAL